MAIAPVGSPVQSGAANGTSCTVTLPQAATAGNLLLIALTTSASGARTIAAPAGGWAALGGFGHASATSASYAQTLIFWKIAAGGETSAAFSWTGNAIPGWEAVEYSGTDTTTPLTLSASFDFTTGAGPGGTLTAPNTRTAAAAGERLLAMLGARALASSGQPTHTWDGAETEPATTGTGVVGQTYLAWQTLATVGATATPSITGYTNTQGNAVAILFWVAISPAASAFTGTATLSGSGQLGATGAPSPADVGTLSGDGSLGATGTPAAPGAAGLSGSGALGATGAPNLPAPASLSGAGTLAALGAPATAEAASLSGDGTLSGSAGAVSASGGADFAGDGSLTALGHPAAGLDAVLSGSGTLAATGGPDAAGAAVLSGSGTLAADAQPATADAAVLSGDGTLTIADTPTGLATFTGEGTLAAGGLPQLLPAGATLGGSGTLAGSASPTPGQIVPLSGTGTLTTIGAAQIAAAATLAGLGTLAALGVPAYAAPAGLSGEGTLEAFGVGAPVHIIVVVATLAPQGGYRVALASDRRRYRATLAAEDPAAELAQQDRYRARAGSHQYAATLGGQP